MGNKSSFKPIMTWFSDTLIHGYTMRQGNVIMAWHENAFLYYWPFVCKSLQLPADSPHRGSVMQNLVSFCSSHQQAVETFELLVVRVAVYLTRHPLNYLIRWNLFNICISRIDRCVRHYSEVANIIIKSFSVHKMPICLVNHLMSMCEQRLFIYQSVLYPLINMYGST